MDLPVAGAGYVLAHAGGGADVSDGPDASGPTEEDARPARLPGIVAVIPARNEAGVVAKAVASLAGQDYEGAFHIVLVDDASEDGTAAIARASAAGAKR